MPFTQIFKKVLIPCAAGVAQVAEKEQHTFGPNCVKKPEQGQKPSSLPIYGKECTLCREAQKEDPPPSSMEETVGNIRRELWVWQDNLKGYRHKIVDVYRKGFSKADCPENTQARNHLENSLNEKLDQPGQKPVPTVCKKGKADKPKFEKFVMDRCGRPCSDVHKPNPPNPPQKKVFAPCSLGEMQTEGNETCHCGEVEMEPKCDNHPKERQKQKSLLCHHNPSAQELRSRQVPDKPPPTEGSTEGESCPCCQPECKAKNLPLEGCNRIFEVKSLAYDGIDPPAFVDYLREPPHGPHRVGAIAISGLTGYILGLRRGKIRRMFYGTFGGMSMAAICYPEEAKDYLESAVLEGRRLFIVAYHFICGETPQFPEWLEKFVGPVGQKEGEDQTINTSLESKKAILNEETEPTKEKKP